MIGRKFYLQGFWGAIIILISAASWFLKPLTWYEHQTELIRVAIALVYFILNWIWIAGFALINSWFEKAYPRSSKKVDDFLDRVE